MRKEEAKQRIGKLKEAVNKHRYLYHVLDRQEISDEALDSLKKELFDLEAEFPEFIAADSPTQRVAGFPLEKFGKVKHEKPMLSLNDAFSKENMADWFERISKLLNEKEREQIDFYCELKIDGLAIELIYEKGLLKSGSTRGDGKTGEDVTQNLKTVEAIPLELRSKKEIIEELKKEKISPEIIKSAEEYDFRKPVVIRGEVFISKNSFEKINKEQEKAGLSLYANPRNLAAGSVRQLDPKVIAARHLDSFAYELITDFKQKTHEEKHKILKALGFKTNPNNKLCRNLENIFSFHSYIQKTREEIYYEIDGIVVIVNSNEIFEKLGVAGKAPRGAVAYKFPLKQAITEVQDIRVQVGRTGVLTPVAVLRPVQVSGIIISRATLHNEDEIRRLGLKIGDTVVVGRAGDVIPDIIKVLPELRTGKEKEFKMPKICPICASPAERKPGEAATNCTNPNCFAIQKEGFYHFVSRGAFDIVGLGPKIIDKLLDAGLISDPADLFTLKEGDIIPLEGVSRKKSKSLLQGFAEKSAKNLIKAINQKKKITFSKFIYALGIRNVGEETSRDLALYFGNMDKLAQAVLKDLTKIEDVGPVVASSIKNWFRQKRNIKFLEKIKKAGIKIEESRPVSKEGRGKLNGLTFVLTGTLEAMSRAQAKEKIRENGGNVFEAVSTNTNFLLAGKNSGSKLEKAKKIGIRVLSEREFLELIK